MTSRFTTIKGPPWTGQQEPTIQAKIRLTFHRHATFKVSPIIHCNSGKKTELLRASTLIAGYGNPVYVGRLAGTRETGLEGKWHGAL
mmetsp:Transcript_63980/g.123057  ORF Transcript_63980/g.123057 Transcript_63980/m.123057 type:complete len:87 (+) Transcript_63980:484-744(+)